METIDNKGALNDTLIDMSTVIGYAFLTFERSLIARASMGGSLGRELRLFGRSLTGRAIDGK